MGPRWQKLLKEYGEALIIALLLALFIRTFIVEAFKIPSGSMLDTVQIGDHLLVNKFLYGIKIPFTDRILIPIKDPRHGDVIVFRYPVTLTADDIKWFQENQGRLPDDVDVDYIKRVIGLPGDRIRIEQKQVWRNGELLNEPYVQHRDPFIQQQVCDPPPAETPSYLEFRANPRAFCRDNVREFTVPQDKYFVMGDNRDASADSRFWGFVDRGAIKGKAFLVYWSWSGLTDIRWDRIGMLVR